jgi:hypothetical protein
MDKAEGLNLSQFYLYPHAHLEKFYQSLGFITNKGYESEVAGHEIIKMEKEM